MKYVTKQEITGLIEHTTFPALTIYMPTHATASPLNAKEGTLRFKNSITAAKELLKQKNVPADTQKAIINRLEDLLANNDFWLHQSEGLAIFASHSTLLAYNLATNIDEYVALDNSYHLTPLLVELEENQPYYALALSVHNPRLFFGDSARFDRSSIQLPASPESALNIDEMHTSKLQPRGARVRQPSTGSAPALFHGHGGSPEDIDDEARLRFYRIIDDIICNKVDTHLPLVLIGTTDHVAEYKGISRHKFIIESAVEGNRKRSSLPELHQLTQAVINQNITQTKQSDIVEQFDELVGHNRSLTGESEAQKAANEGRVESLLVGMIINTTDTPNDTTLTTPTITFPENYSLVEAVARSVYQKGGRVLGLAREFMPRQSAMAAILRY